MSEPRKVYPLLSTQRHLITGGNFVAGVEALCRVLAESEGKNEWWMLGVQPGGVAEEADTPNDAHIRFSAAFEAVLKDFADAAADFDGFTHAVRAFINDVNQPAFDDWRATSEAFKSGVLKPEAPFDTLPRRPADTPCYVNFVRLDNQSTFTPMETGLEPPIFADAA